MRRNVCSVALAGAALCLGAMALARPATPEMSLAAYVAAAPAAPAQTIGCGDLVSVQVWNAEQVTTRQRVRADGCISLQFVHDVQIAGLTAGAAADTVAARLDGFVHAPRVNVIIEDSAASTIAVLGEVTRPGSYPAATTATLLQALSAAQGLTDFAHRDRIYVLRADAAPARLRTSWKALSAGAPETRAFRLRPGDVVVVE